MAKSLWVQSNLSVFSSWEFFFLLPRHFLLSVFFPLRSCPRTRDGIIKASDIIMNQLGAQVRIFFIGLWDCFPFFVEAKIAMKTECRVQHWHNIITMPANFLLERDISQEKTISFSFQLCNQSSSGLQPNAAPPTFFWWRLTLHHYNNSICYDKRVGPKKTLRAGWRMKLCKKWIIIYAHNRNKQKKSGAGPR